MWLFLCPEADTSARWAYEGLKNKGLDPLEWLTPEMLTQSLCWNHRLGSEGINTAIELANGRTIHSHQIQGVLNRLQSVPIEWLSLAQPSDRDYVAQELTAFFLSWLYALPCPILNRPTPQGLAGQWRSLPEWLWLAAQAGLPTVAYRQSSQAVDTCYAGGQSQFPNQSIEKQTTIMVADQRVGASIPPDLWLGCQRLAHLAKTELLGIEWAIAPNGSYTLVGATLLPDLTIGGEALLDTLASVFTAKEIPFRGDNGAQSTAPSTLSGSWPPFRTLEVQS